MNPALPTALAAALAVHSAAAVQSHPEFSGTWIMDAARSQSPVQNEPVKQITLVIRQTPSTITIDSRRDDRQQTITYQHGAADAVVPGRGRTGLLASMWYWEAEKLVTETLSDVNGMTVRTRAIHTLQGGELTVESLVVVEHGYTMRGGKNYGSVTDVFKRAP